MKPTVRLLLALALFSGMAVADNIFTFTQSNGNTPLCTSGSPCGTIDVALGTGGFAGDLVVTVDLTVPYQFDKFGFDSDIPFPGLSLLCFNFGAGCSSGVGGASLNGSGQEDGFGKFDYTLLTGLHGGSGCDPSGNGCEEEFTFVLGGSSGLSLSDFGSSAAGHVANGAGSGYIATGGAPPVPEPSSLALFGSGAIGLFWYFKRRLS